MERTPPNRIIPRHSNIQELLVRTQDEPIGTRPVRDQRVELAGGSETVDVARWVGEAGLSLVGEVCGGVSDEQAQPAFTWTGFASLDSSPLVHGLELPF
jgi:hypothetical protein